MLLRHLAGRRAVNAFLERAGLFRFVFVALLVLFNWPVLSIPMPEHRLTWLFVVWLLAIVFLWLATRMVSSSAGAGTGADPAVPPPGSRQTDSRQPGKEPQPGTPNQTREGADV